MPKLRAGCLVYCDHLMIVEQVAALSTIPTTRFEDLSEIDVFILSGTISKKKDGERLFFPERTKLKVPYGNGK